MLVSAVEYYRQIVVYAKKKAAPNGAAFSMYFE
jgi:hypothetical protein